MSIAATDRMYFIDPVQPPVQQLGPNAKLFIMDRLNNRTTGPQLGDIIPIQRVAKGDWGQYWYVSDGNFYNGAVMNSEQTLRRNREVISFVGDDALFGMSAGTASLYNYRITGGLWFSRKRDTMPGGLDIREYNGTNAVYAASWAAELWPLPEDSDEMAEAKVELAKQLWTNRYHHAGVLREAIVRDWMETLNETDYYDKLSMPRGEFGVHFEGAALVNTDVQVELNSVDGFARDRVNNLLSIQPGGTAPVRATTAVAIPVKFIHQADASAQTLAALNALGSHQSELLTTLARITGEYGVASLQVNEVSPVLISLPAQTSAF